MTLENALAILMLSVIACLIIRHIDRRPPKA